MAEEIRFYSKNEQYAFLSNFHKCDFTLDGRTWATVEHYFQAAKTDDQGEIARVHGADTPAKAKALGRRVMLRTNWEAVKLDVMRKGLAAKFAIPDLRARLIATGEARLIEAAPRDYFWGAGAKGTGKNWLGVLLMELRVNLGQRSHS